MSEYRDDKDQDPNWLYPSTEPIPQWSHASQDSQAALEQDHHHTYASPMFSLGDETYAALDVGHERTQHLSNPCISIDHFGPFSTLFPIPEQVPRKRNGGSGLNLGMTGITSSALGSNTMYDDDLFPHMAGEGMPVDSYIFSSMSDHAIDPSSGHSSTSMTALHQASAPSAPDILVRRAGYAARQTEPSYSEKSEQIDIGDNMASSALHATSSRLKERRALDICAIQPTDDPSVFVFRCTFPRCRERTFTRWYDFHRHYNGAHALEKTVFWCPVLGCGRSEGDGNHGFPRKDKMLDHVSKIHSQACQTQTE